MCQERPVREISKILFQEEAARGHFRLVLEASAIAASARPGQFLHIRVSDGTDPLLRRPFSIHRVREGGKIEILYKVVGRGTRLLSKKREDETLDILGPLGQGFFLDHSLIPYQILLVGGGIGVAPLLFLAEELVTTYKVPITVLLGAKTREELLCEKEFERLGAEIKIATYNGSYGHQGLVTELLPITNYKLPSTIFTCGPTLMLKEVARFAKAYNISCQVLLERFMACGLGACLGCVIKTKDGYRRVCKDGPVFVASEVVWDGC